MQIGDKVVFVAQEHSLCPNTARHMARQTAPYQLVTGRVYTIIGFGKKGRDPLPGLLLAETIHHPCGFCRGRFRKIERSTLTLKEMMECYQHEHS